MYLAAESSGKLTTDQQVITGAGRITAVSIVTDGTNAVDVVIYDNTSAAGKVVWPGGVAGANKYGGRNFGHPVKFYNGLYLDITIAGGTGGGCVVEWAAP